MDLLCKGVAKISKHYYGMMVILLVIWNSNLNCVEYPSLVLILYNFDL